MIGIDLYSGIGGWTLGFRAAGAEIIRSYERWSLANATHGLNHGCVPADTDIRNLSIDDLPSPESLDFVVGSPPCTQFSFSNRGGSGDLADGLVDIRKFLEIVRHLRPRRWAMENVPRVGEILRRELSSGGKLEEFAGLFTAILVVDASEFGLPQRRKRMLAGDFDEELLKSYRSKCRAKTLGDLLQELDQGRPFDPNWGFSIDQAELTDHLLERPLSAEEERMNREAKTHHPVYNRMAFPDRTDRPARTVTATCTRVSRESTIVEDAIGYRRLTVRERAMLQGFPISYQFASGSHADRVKMAGNAIPPVLTYYLAMAMQEVQPKDLVILEDLGFRHRAYSQAASALPEVACRTYPPKRSFRFAIPGLRFHSGVRFELRNRFEADEPQWRVEFHYGDAKRVIRADLEIAVERLAAAGFGWLLEGACRGCPRHNAADLQASWSHRRPGPGPFDLIDELGGLSTELASRLTVEDATLPLRLYPGLSEAKAVKFCARILAGTAIAATFNAAEKQSLAAAS